MSEPCQQHFCCNPNDLHQAMAVHVKKITDSCRDKDCIEDLRVYLTRGSQNLLDTACNTKVRSAELLYTYIDVEPVAFDRHHYCIDVTFYYRILADVTVGINRPATAYGLAVFTKRIVLCGEDSHTHIFRSDTRLGEADGATLQYANRPTAVVEVLDPMVLGSKVRDVCEDKCRDACALQLPGCLRTLFDDELVTTGERRRLYVTLGQFSIVRLERDAQLLVPVLDYAIPIKECCENPGATEDPCELFSRIPFPTGQFAPNGCDTITQDTGPACGCEAGR